MTQAISVRYFANGIGLPGASAECSYGDDGVLSDQYPVVKDDGEVIERCDETVRWAWLIHDKEQTPVLFNSGCACYLHIAKTLGDFVVTEARGGDVLTLAISNG